MSFVNMSSKKRDELVNEYYKLKNELKDRFISKSIGEQYISKEREKQFKPLTDEMKKQAEEQKKLLEDILENKRSEQLAIGYKPIEIENPDNSIISTCPFGSKYLSTALNKSRDYDSTFGVNRIGKSLTFGNKQIGTDDKDNIMINNKKYIGTEGLWELLTRLRPNEDLINKEDEKDYEEIMLEIGNLFNALGNIKGNKQGYKYNKYIKPIVQKYYINMIKGSGINTITISSDPNELLERMDLLIASKEAGNTGVDEELQAILKSLYKKKIINKEQLKILSNKND